MRDYEELTSEWEELLEVLRCCQADLDAVKHLIFDTYHFLKTISRAILFRETD